MPSTQKHYQLPKNHLNNSWSIIIMNLRLSLTERLLMNLLQKIAKHRSLKVQKMTKKRFLICKPSRKFKIY